MVPLKVCSTTWFNAFSVNLHFLSPTYCVCGGGEREREGAERKTGGGRVRERQRETKGLSQSVRGFAFCIVFTYFVSCNGPYAPKEKWHRQEHISSSSSIIIIIIIIIKSYLIWMIFYTVDHISLIKVSKRLEEDLCWIALHVPPDEPISQGTEQNWTGRKQHRTQDTSGQHHLSRVHLQQNLPKHTDLLSSSQ